MLRVMVACLLLVCLAPALAQIHTFNVPRKEDGRFNPFVVTDRRGAFYVVYIRRIGGVCNVMLRRSEDGKTFSDDVRVNDREGDAMVRDESPPKVAVSPKGEVYVCWTNERAPNRGDIRFARSTDGGKTFSPAITLNSDAGGDPVGRAFQSIAVDSKGRIYVAWVDERNKIKDLLFHGARGAEIWLAISEDGGKTFAHDRKILSDVCECSRTNLQMDSAGRLFLAYRTLPRKGPMYRDVTVARSEDKGRTFSNHVVSRDQWEVNGCPVSGPSLCIDASDRVTAVWFMGGGNQPGLYYAISTDHGATYSARKLLDASRKLGQGVHAVAGPENKILVSWDDLEDGLNTYWGAVDPQTGLMGKNIVHHGASYPILAVTRKIALVAAMQTDTKDLLLEPEPMNEWVK